MNTVIIKRYANRKLYVTKGNTEPSGYVSLQNIIDIVRKGKDVSIVDNESGVDITSEILTGALAYTQLSVEQLMGLIRL